MPNLPMNINNNNNNKEDNMRALKDIFSVGLTVLSVVISITWFLSGLDKNMQQLSKNQEQMLSVLTETKNDIAKITEKTQKHETAIALQSKENENIIDKIKNVDEKINTTKEVILYKNSKGVK